MAAKYIIRLDDANPYMKRENWDIIENLLDRYKIKPIVAVVPNNKDKKLMFDDFDENFWQKVKKYEHKGWKIALHGYEHIMHKVKNSLIPINNYSEFSELPYDEQYKKLMKAKKILDKNGIYTDLWVAPAHNFDKNTLRALKKIEIKYISDGFGFYPFMHEDFIWIPQQFWRYRWMPFGIWTICLHPNVMTLDSLKNLEKVLKKHHHKFISFDYIHKIRINRRKNILEKGFEKIYYKILNIKGGLKQ